MNLWAGLLVAPYICMYSDDVRIVYVTSVIVKIGVDVIRVFKLLFFRRSNRNNFVQLIDSELLNGFLVAFCELDG